MNYAPRGRRSTAPRTALSRQTCGATRAALAHSNEANTGDFDPRQLSRARLMVELLAPVPAIGPGEAGFAADGDSGIALSPAFDAAVAHKLSVARELLCRDLLTDMRGHPILDKPDLLGEWLRLHCAGLDYEVFLVLYLDARHRLIAIEQLFRGTLTQVSVYPREVLKGALKHGAAELALAHNHPLC